MGKENQGTRTDILQNSAKCLKPVDTRAEIAKVAKTSHDTIYKVEKIEEKADKETKPIESYYSLLGSTSLLRMRVWIAFVVFNPSG